jgi:hypothetical protein
MSLIIKKNTTFKIPRTPPFLPSSLGGLALWLKPDVGVATFRNAYTSQIILSGGTSSILNKTFVASGTPDPNNYYYYSFGENNGYFITYSQDDTPFYNLRYIAQGTGNIIILNSTDGISWSLVYNMPNTITISGITGTHSSANRTYNLYSYDGDNGIFYFDASGSDYFISTGDGSGASSTNWFLYKVDPNSPYPFLISTGPLKSSAPSGSWTNNLSSGSPSSTYIGVANGTLPTGSVTTSEYGDFLVTAWEDQSGNGKNATAIESPTYATNSINGKPALVFANDAHLTTANIFNGANPRTVIAAYYIDSDNYSNTVVAQSNEDDTVMGTYFMLQSRIDQNSSPYLAGYVDDLSGPAFISPELLIGMADYDGTTARLFKNGVEVNSDVKNYNTHNGQLYIGACNIAGAVVEYFGGKIAEIIIYNRILTTPERQQVETYLNQKYAIY